LKVAKLLAVSAVACGAGALNLFNAWFAGSFLEPCYYSIGPSSSQSLCLASVSAVTWVWALGFALLLVGLVGFAVFLTPRTRVIWGGVVIVLSAISYGLCVLIISYRSLWPGQQGGIYLGIIFLPALAVGLLAGSLGLILNKGDSPKAGFAVVGQSREGP
jgi:hypothetical protein